MKNQHKYYDGVPVNTELHKKNDNVIKKFLDKYDNYQLSNEFKKFMKDHNDIFIEKQLIPDLVMKEVFNKNFCFV